MKQRVVFTLPNQLYSENKVKVKKVMKAHGLAFNQGALHSANIYLWQGDGEQVEGKFTKDESGLTVHSELVWSGKERSTFLSAFEELVKELGGSWEIVGEEELHKEEADELEEERKNFDKRMWNRLLTEENYSKRKGLEHCPVLKPMITEELTERFKKFGLKDLTAWDVLAEVYAMSDSEVVE